MNSLNFNKNLRHRPGFSLVIGILASAFFGLVFLKITSDVWLQQEHFPLDDTVSAWMANAQSLWGYDIFHTITLMGGTKLIITLAIMASGYLGYRRYWHECLTLVAGVAATTISVMLFKSLINRARPISDYSAGLSTLAFPSGHMAHSLFLYGFLAYLLSRRAKTTLQAFWILVAGIGLALLIGLSRLYLNAHWLTDILGGFSLAAAYLCLCIGFLEFYQKRSP